VAVGVASTVGEALPGREPARGDGHRRTRPVYERHASVTERRDAIRKKFNRAALTPLLCSAAAEEDSNSGEASIPTPFASLAMPFRLVFPVVGSSLLKDGAGVYERGGGRQLESRL